MDQAARGSLPALSGAGTIIRESCDPYDWVVRADDATAWVCAVVEDDLTPLGIAWNTIERPQRPSLTTFDGWANPMMTDRLARALRALADHISPPRPIVINTAINVDGKTIARAVEEAAARHQGR